VASGGGGDPDDDDDDDDDEPEDDTGNEPPRRPSNQGRKSRSRSPAKSRSRSPAKKPAGRDGSRKGSGGSSSSRAPSRAQDEDEPDTGKIKSPILGPKDSLENAIRKIATAEEQMVMDGYYDRVVELPRKYVLEKERVLKRFLGGGGGGGGGGDDDDDDDDDDGGKGNGGTSHSWFRNGGTYANMYQPDPPPRTMRPGRHLPPSKPSSNKPAGSPKRNRSAPGTEQVDESEPEQSKPGDLITSRINPKKIEVGNKTIDNPFYETLPGEETWYSRMPHFPPFGETPFMEQQMSREINEDLARGNYTTPIHAHYSLPNIHRAGHEKDQSARRTSSTVISENLNKLKDAAGSFVTRMFSRTPTPAPEPSAPPKIRSVWDLPDVDEKEVDEEYLAISGGFRERRAQAGEQVVGRKRKASTQIRGGSGKRSKREKGEYLMSAAM
jgi:hypothetical protein